jgi:hypothetical protein
MKKLSIIAAIALGLLACVSMANAQGGGGGGKKGGGGGGRGGAMTADVMVSNIVVACKLDDAAKTKITPIVTKMMADRQALFTGGAPDQAAMQKVTDDYNAAMKAALTPEQFTAFQAMPPMGRGGRGAGGKKGGGAPGAAPGA